MHVVNRLFLKFVLLPLPWYVRMGVNTAQLKSILTTKLILDDRRPRPLAQMQRKKERKPASMATLGTMLMSALTGFLFLFCFFLTKDTATQLTMYFTFFFVFLSLTLITDFTTVLIDVRDNYILLPKPVSDKTVVVARLLHIFIHLCKIVVPMCLPAIGYIGFTTGIYAALLLLLLVFLLTAFSIFFINAVYIAILKFTTPQRFQSIITYVQIVFAILIYSAYQVLPRMMGRYFGNDFSISNIKGIAFFPLYWLANSWKFALSFKGNSVEVITGIIGILFPLLCIFIVVKYLAPSFNRKLSMLSASESSTKKVTVFKSPQSRSLANFLARLFTSCGVERASFVFTWKMTSRSRDFKLKVYPSMGYLIFYLVFVLYSNKHISLASLRENPTAAKWTVLSALYLSIFLLSMAIGQVVFSDKYKASWIFYTSPLANPGHIISGATKAVLSKFFLPIAAFISAASLFIAGPSVLPNLLFGLSNVVLLVALMVYASNHYFPFSSAQSTNAKTGSFLKALFIMIVSGLVAFGHYLIYTIMPALIICTLLSLLAVWLLFDSLRRMNWGKILSAYTEE